MRRFTFTVLAAIALSGCAGAFNPGARRTATPPNIFAAVNQPATITGPWTYLTPYADFTTQVAFLPQPALTQINATATITDSQSADSCLNGGGTLIIQCFNNGRQWLPKGIVGGAVNIDLENPQVVDSGKFQFTPKSALHVSLVYCSPDLGVSATIQFEERQASTPDVAGTPLLVNPLVCGPSGATTTAFVNNRLVGGNPVALIITAISGSPGIVRAAVEF